MRIVRLFMIISMVCAMSPVTEALGSDPPLIGESEKAFELAADNTEIRGLAFDETRIADLLGELEKGSCFIDPNLLNTERLSSDTVWKMTKIRKVALIRFTLLVKVFYV